MRPHVDEDTTFCRDSVRPILAVHPTFAITALSNAMPRIQVVPSRYLQHVDAATHSQAGYRNVVAVEWNGKMRPQ